MPENAPSRVSRRRPGSKHRVLKALAILSCALSASGQIGNVVPGGADRIVQQFDDEGRLLSQTLFRGEKKTGRFVSYWPKGGERVRAFYDGDRIEGEYRSWHANGRLAELKHYEGGHESGLQQAWTDRG